MKFRTAKPQDAAAIGALYEEAKASLRALGIDQWQRGIPSAETAAADIAAGVCRVAEKDGRVVLSYTFVPGGEADYKHIDGAWLTEGEDYAAMHRVVLTGSLRGSGAAAVLVRHVLAEARGRGFPSVRVDTHPGNIPMRRMLEKNGFVLCGKIHLIGGPDDGAERVAYERLLTRRVYDITQELFSSVVWPGDPAPTPEKLAAIADGAAVNVTALHMCAHNGTHLDAPLHFIDGGKSVTDFQADVFVGEADVVFCEKKFFTAEDAARLIPADCRRLLIGGGAIPDEGGAEEIVRRGIVLVGAEPQSIGDAERPRAVHMILLSADIIALEGIRLGGVPAGRYNLFAAPMKCAGIEGAPVRAVLQEI